MRDSRHFFITLTFLPIAMIACGLLSICLGKELGWDLANYHFYNPYAYFHHRSQLDFWPSSFITQYFNPAIDFTTYFFISYFSTHRIEFLLGALHGINLWLLFLICCLFLNDHYKYSLAFLFALIGMYGPTAFPEIGSFQNDNLVSIFVLAFVLLQLHALQQSIINKKLSLLAGFALGIGIGLKLTAGIYIVGALLSFSILPITITERIKLIAYSCFAMAIGIFLSSGYWMLMLWNQHHNPFFPFFNNLFHSPDFANLNWRDQRFLPKNIWQALFFPYYFSWDGRTTDTAFRDFRFLISYALFILVGLKSLIEKIMHKVQTPLTLKIHWLYAFFIFSFIAWEYYFSISRYLISLEMLSPLMIYLLVSQLTKNTYLKAISLTMILYSLVFFMYPMRMVRMPINNADFFNVKLPKSIQTIPQALVLISYPAYVVDLNPRPQTYLIPFFPEQWHFIGIPFLHGSVILDTATSKKIAALLNSPQPYYYLLSEQTSLSPLYQIARQFGLVRNGHCEKVESDRQKLAADEVLLCPVRKI